MRANKLLKMENKNKETYKKAIKSLNIDTDDNYNREKIIYQISNIIRTTDKELIRLLADKFNYLGYCIEDYNLPFHGELTEEELFERITYCIEDYNLPFQDELTEEELFETIIYTVMLSNGLNLSYIMELCEHWVRRFTLPF